MSVRAFSWRRGFTLMELMVVVTVILIATLFILPMFMQQRAAQTDRAFRTDLRRLAQLAREQAIRTQETVTLRIETGAQEMRVEPDGPTARVPESVSYDGGQTGPRDTQVSGDWSMEFRPDGTTEGGWVQFSQGESPLFLLVRPDGSSELTDTQPEPRRNETWSAGEYERRA